MPTRILYRRNPQPSRELSAVRTPRTVYQLYHHLIFRPWRTTVPSIFNYLTPVIRRLFDVSLTFFQDHVIPRVFAAASAFIRPPPSRAQPQDAILVAIPIDRYRFLLDLGRIISTLDLPGPDLATPGSTTPDLEPPGYFPNPLPFRTAPPVYPAPTIVTPFAGPVDPLSGHR